MTWHASLATLPTDAPVIFIGNEFLDALPIRQYVRCGNDWHERLIGFENGKFVFLSGNKINAVNLPDAKDGAIFEISPAREAVIDDMTTRIKKQGGSILMIDYGHGRSGVGDTFQAIMNHKYSNVLENQGDADVSSHVDFGRLALNIAREKINVTLCPQSEFLIRAGIIPRAEQLIGGSTPKQAEDIDAALHRLLDDDQMGTLFMVMEARS